MARGEGRVELVDVPIPAAGPNQVLVKVRSAGICGTDLHIRAGAFPRARPPVTLGHEFSGEVAGVGQGVTQWREGDRVTCETEAHSCGACAYCRAGQSNLCPERLAYGYSFDGGMAEYVLVKEDALHRLPDSVSFQQGAVCEPLAVAVHAVLELAPPESGQKALVTGPGPIGLLVLAVLLAKGAEVTLVGTSQDEARLRVAQAMGAARVVMADRQDSLELLKGLNQGRGFGWVWECSGAPAAINLAIDCMRPQGIITQMGLSGGPAPINLDALALKELHMAGAFGHNPATWERTIGLLGEDRIDISPVISGEFSLSQWEKAFALAQRQEGLKFLLRPGE